jgi:hypothetical protein
MLREIRLYGSPTAEEFTKAVLELIERREGAGDRGAPLPSKGENRDSRL